MTIFSKQDILLVDGSCEWVQRWERMRCKMEQGRQTTTETEAVNNHLSSRCCLAASLSSKSTRSARKEHGEWEEGGKKKREKNLITGRLLGASQSGQRWRGGKWLQKKKRREAEKKTSWKEAVSSSLFWIGDGRMIGISYRPPPLAPEREEGIEWEMRREVGRRGDEGLAL